MKKYVLLFLLTFLCHSFMRANENVTLSPDNMQEGNNLNQYRRSSLCILLVTHQGTQYAEDMERQFLKMKLPERYNEHNIQLRVLHTDKTLKAKDIAKLLENNEVGKQLVARWFNRNPYTGAMNMDLIHDRGGYNASMSDAERADMTVRGRAILQEEGVDLIQNTFVLVCDMKYKKRDDAGVWASLGTAFLSAGLSAMGQYTGTDVSQSTEQLNQAAAELTDLSGFSVIMDAHLLQLKWTPDDLNRLYSNYWVDDTTPTAEAQAHKNAFDNAANVFELNYLGHYKSRSTKIEMQSDYGFDDVILEVTDRTVNKSIKELALMFPQFKPKTPLIHTNNGLVAYVGTKEDITNKTEFDVMESVKKNGEIKYNKVGRLNVVDGTVWNNKNVHIDTISDLSSIEGTHLYSKRKKDFSDQQYMLVEGNPSLKKYTFDVGVRLESKSVSHDKLIEQIKEKHNWTHYENDDISYSGITFTWLDLGWTMNVSDVFSWNIIQGRLGMGSIFDIALDTGATIRFAKLGKTGRKTLFLQSSIGYGLLSPIKRCKYQISDYWEEKMRPGDYSYFDWSIKLGVNIKKFYISAGYGANSSIGIYTGFHI